MSGGSLPRAGIHRCFPLFICLLAAAVAGGGAARAQLPDGLYAEIRTGKGTILARLAYDKTPLSDGLDGLRVVRVLEAGTESLRRGGELVTLR